MTRIHFVGSCLAMVVCMFLASPIEGQVLTPFTDSVDTPPMGWAGPVFTVSKAYPTMVPADPKPWKAFDFKTQPHQYLQAVLAYALEGNEPATFKVQDNLIRKWYHAPGLAKFPTSGREFIHGLTRERVTRKKELHPNQTVALSNWAVGFYNPIAAFTIGKVWANPAAPNTAAASFQDGAVAFKLLFSSGTKDQLPFLENSMKWQANIDLADPAATPGRSPRDVLLLQIDVAVRDDRNDALTGWVFGTFEYQNTAPGATPLSRMVPVGLMWGNDPDLTPAKYAMGVRPKQTWINPGLTPTRIPPYGRLDRLNGPVDNPLSSCLSCHARAVAPYAPNKTFPHNESEADDPANSFFTNTLANALYAGAPASSHSLDYSLQLAVGVANFPGAAPAHGMSQISMAGVTNRGGEVDELEAVRATPPPAAQPAPADNTWWLLAGTIAVLVIVLLLVRWWLTRSRGPSAPAGG
jgi:hypothetical protein